MTIQAYGKWKNLNSTTSHLLTIASKICRGKYVADIHRSAKFHKNNLIYVKDRSLVKWCFQGHSIQCIFDSKRLGDIVMATKFDKQMSKNHRKWWLLQLWARHWCRFWFWRRVSAITKSNITLMASICDTKTKSSYIRVLQRMLAKQL